MSWVRIEEFQLPPPIYSQRGLNLDPLISLLPVPGRRQLCTRVTGWDKALEGCFSQKLLLPSLNLAPSPFQRCVPHLAHLGSQEGKEGKPPSHISLRGGAVG